MDYFGILENKKLKLYSVIDVSAAYLNGINYAEHCAQYTLRIEDENKFGGIFGIFNIGDRIYVGVNDNGNKVYAYWSSEGPYFEEKELEENELEQLNKNNKIKDKYLLSGMEFTHKLLDGEIYVMKHDIGLVRPNMVYFKSGVNIRNKNKLHLHRVVLPDNIIALTTIHIDKICRAERLRLKMVTGTIGCWMFSNVHCIEDSVLYITNLNYCNLHAIRNSHIYIDTFTNLTIGILFDAKVFIENGNTAGLVINGSVSRNSLIEFHSSMEPDFLATLKQWLQTGDLDVSELTFRVTEGDYKKLTNNEEVQYRALERWEG